MISIHTTTQVVTNYDGSNIKRGKISIHTTTQVVTICRKRPITRSTRFQSTPPRRWWPDTTRISGQFCIFQSTPPRRWWRWGTYYYQVWFTFQSTPPRRWWQLFAQIINMFHVFQSTPPRRWWPLATKMWAQTTTFQSTPPRRWWLFPRLLSRIQHIISIHTTTQVVTFLLGFYYWFILYFNPHHHAGGDIEINWINMSAKISIHTTTQVVTAWPWGQPSRALRFQSTPPRRWWQQIYTTIHTYIRQFSYKSFTATTYHLQTLQIHPKNTNYSWFPRCEPPRGFMGTSHSHGRIWKLKVIQNICFTQQP